MSYPEFKLYKQLCIDFLENYKKNGVSKYMTVLQEITNRESKLLPIELDDVQEHMATNTQQALAAEFVRECERNAAYFLKLFAEAADGCMSNMKPTDEAALVGQKDVYDVLLDQRKRAQELAQDAANAQQMPVEAGQIPAELLRRYQVVLHPRTAQAPRRMRNVDSRYIGGLVSVKGIVTQVTDVKPLITVACYLDEQNGVEVYQEVTGRTFSPLTEVPQMPAPAPKSKGQLHLQVRGCKFVRYQEVKLQELPDEVPTGETPRSLLLHLRGELTRSAKPGEVVTVAGVFLPEPYRGHRGMRAGLLTSTYLEAQRVGQDKTSYKELAMEGDMAEQIDEVRAGGDVYDRLASSIAPEIYGHEDVKKALLLLMVDGVSRQLPDGMKLRGNIHMCLMGDPGVAKSQLLRFLTHVSPRAVFTTGKGSSGVGLTAAVTKDPNTGEMVLEGGALVMADKGICCIDEFDKMDEVDRTSIHEVMEQQTVSIAKAGITTTLNTRCSVLAAANPAWGRYDTRRSPAENIALPAALLSRFDLLWLILDKTDTANDHALAEHVLQVHTHGAAPQPVQAPLPPALLRAYIARAKQYEPHVPSALADYIAAVYAEMRADEAASDMPHSYTTARSLLSILRISQALARLRFDSEVGQSDVDESLRLMRMSKSSLYEERGDWEGREDPVSRCYFKIREALLRSSDDVITLGWTALRKLLGGGSGGFSDEIVRQCLEEYAASNVWQLEGDADRPALVFRRAEAVRVE